MKEPKHFVSPTLRALWLLTSLLIIVALLGVLAWCLGELVILHDLPAGTTPLATHFAAFTRFVTHLWKGIRS